MLKTDITWSDDFRYRTKSEWEPVGFFSEALCNATSFDLMLGFFSSAAINVLSYGFATFLYNGGKMRMIVNDILSAEDVNVISIARESTALPYFNLKDLEALSYTLNRRDRHFFDCLAWLIRRECIDIRIVRIVNGAGIAHTKCGTFSDGINRIAFNGSLNFSLSALLHNKEELSVNCDWNGAADISRINSIQRDFDQSFNGLDPDVEFVKAEEIKNYILNREKPKTIEELLSEELELIETTKSIDIPESVRKILDKTRIKVLSAIDKLSRVEHNNDEVPRFPYASGPREYQVEAFENWRKTQKGLFAMATGTGKTLTSLNCLLEIFKRKGYYKAIILVPTLTLVDQWE